MRLFGIEFAARRPGAQYVGPANPGDVLRVVNYGGVERVLIVNPNHPPREVIRENGKYVIQEMKLDGHHD